MKRMPAALIVSLVLGACASPRAAVGPARPEARAGDTGRATETSIAPASIDKVEAPAAPARLAGDSLRTIAPDDAPSMQTPDPWERFNRSSYRFDARFDESVMVPVSNGYRHLPSPARVGVHNFFSNLRELVNVVNYALQARPRGMFRSIGRFAINTTLGIGGLIDVAQRFNLHRTPTGFGDTLATWGVHPGPYVVIPFLGPSTLREGLGLLADFGLSYSTNLGGLYTGSEAWYLGSTTAVDQRATSRFRYYATGSPFEYERIRFLYVHKRLIEDQRLDRLTLFAATESTTPVLQRVPVTSQAVEATSTKAWAVTGGSR